MVQTKLHNQAFLKLESFVYIAKELFNKIKILCPAMIGLKESS